MRAKHLELIASHKIVLDDIADARGQTAAIYLSMPCYSGKTAKFGAFQLAHQERDIEDQRLFDADLGSTDHRLSKQY